ncbi:DUF1707 SHOCT-like domain-containing protein [Nonomuraea jiangxiensis]|uniref:DUF1707 domain-containing protein n=1 Tax=Nonomuraea jiangxiensis TaxID=633440 RepID=A0A1G9F7N5_9ACTN|nr:DUF1707 domain-containing protein [Nonomuraea jiangxiensis]SDK84409.1 protein of unknown function [Nonomuraea jiangxiensis]
MNRLPAHLSERDREQAVELVQQAYAEGRLDPAELERRLDLALTATSAQELEPILGDLPDEVVRLRSTGGRVTRAGDWQVPRRLHIESEFGKVRLDLSEARIPYPRIDIELRLAHGGATILLPAGASANVDGVRTEWGRVTCKAAGRPRPGGLHVQISGELPFGRLTVRTTRR